MYCVSGPWAVAVRIWTGGHCLAFQAFICVQRRRRATQVRRTIIYCVIKHASFVRMLLQWRTQNWRSFSSWQNELRRTPHRDSGRKVQNNCMAQVRKVMTQWLIKYHAMKTYEGVEVIGPRVLVLGTMWKRPLRKESLCSLDRRLSEMYSRWGHWRGDTPLAVGSCTSFTEPVVVTKLSSPGFPYLLKV